MWSINLRKSIFLVFLLFLLLFFFLSQNDNQNPIVIDTSEFTNNKKVLDGSTISKSTTQNTPLAELPQSKKARTFRYKILAENKTGKGLSRVKFSIFSPMQSTSTQNLISIKSNGDYDIVEDPLGNSILEFNIENLLPYAKNIYNIEVKMEMASQPQLLALSNKSLYLQNQPLLSLDDPEIIKLAQSLSSDQPIETTKLIYDWVKNNLQYIGFVSTDRGAKYAMEKKEGDCTEFAYLLTALSRLNNIPSRIMAGYVYEKDAIIRPEDYHNWVEVYLDNSWKILDPINNVFLDSNGSHIATRIISQNAYNDLGSQKSIISDNNLKVQML